MKNGKSFTIAKLARGVLVLTRTFLPVMITTVKGAMVLLCTDRAKVVDENYQTYTLDEWLIHTNQEALIDEQLIRTVNKAIEIPNVLQLVDMNNPPKYQVKFSYLNILTRDDYKCQYCGKYFEKRDLTVDHVHPRSKGGKSTWENCVAACFPCNTKKADKTLQQAHLRLPKQPRKPASIFKLRRKCLSNERWKLFI